MLPLRLSVAQMVAQAREMIEEIDSAVLMVHLDDPSWVVVDIRDVRERQREGYIPGSFHAPRGMLEFWVDPQSPYFKSIFADHDKKFVLYCASGWRSALAAQTLNKMGFPVMHLQDGFTAWKQHSHALVTKA